MRIFFIGCVESSVRFLNELIEKNKEIVGVITKDKSAFNSDFVDLSSICSKNDVPYRYSINANESDDIDFIRSVRPEICLCFGWSHLLKDELISQFPLGVVGFHPAALPNNRGRHPIIWALALGLNETASTFFMIDAGADEGDIISQKRIEIRYEDDARSLYDKIMSVAVTQEIELIESFENGVVKRIKQNESDGNTWRKRDNRDGEIDWRMSSRSIYNLVRSLTRPYIGAHFILSGKPYKVWKLQELEMDGHINIEPGKVLAKNADGTMDIKVADGAVRLLEFDKVELNSGDYIL